MFTGVLSFLKSVFQFMSTSTSHPGKASDGQQSSSSPSPFVPLSTSVAPLDISEYMKMLRSQALLGPKRRQQLAKHMVTKLEHMKESGNAQHELVIATVVDHNENEVHISIGRSQGSGKNPPKDRDTKKRPKTTHTRSSTMTLSSIPNSSQDSIYKPTKATDVLKNIGQEDFNRYRSRLQSVFIPSSDFPLLRLAVIIDTVHDCESRYALLRSQCYWFAMMIMGISMTLGGKIRVMEKQSMLRAGELSQEKDLASLNLSSPNPSDVNRIPISTPPPVEEPSLDVGVGRHGRVPIVAIPVEDILSAAQQSELRYHALNMELENEWNEINVSFNADATEEVRRRTEAEKKAIAQAEAEKQGREEAEKQIREEKQAREEAEKQTREEKQAREEAEKQIREAEKVVRARDEHIAQLQRQLEEFQRAR